MTQNNMITKEKLSEIFLKYENKEFSFEKIVKQLKNILSELSKGASKEECGRLMRIELSLDQSLDDYIKAISDAGIHIPGANDKLKKTEYALREVIGNTKLEILDLVNIRTPTPITAKSKKPGEDEVEKEPTVYESPTLSGDYLSGDYITHYADRAGGKTIMRSAPATIYQEGLDIRGETTLLGRTWILKGKIDDDDWFVDGKYYAKSRFDKGRGYFFLKINPIGDLDGGDLDGYWIGYDSDNKIINEGCYWFKRTPEIQIQSITESYYQNVLDLSSRCLGKGYLPVIPHIETNKSVFLVAISSKKFIGFAYAKMIEKNELNDILKNQQIRIPPDIKRANETGTLGFLNTVCVEPDYKGRGVATILVKECLKNLVTLGAKTLICIAWKSSAGVHIGGVIRKLGFRKWITLDKFWAEESKSLNYSCPVCGDPPCDCSAVICKCTDFDFRDF